MKARFYNNPIMFVGEGEDNSPPATPPEPGETFTQEQVNSMLATAKHKQDEAHKKSSQDSLTQLQMLQTKAKLTTDENTELTTQIEDLQKKVFTSDELMQQAAAKQKKQFDTERSDLTQDRDLWRDRYSEETITRSITDAAASNDAFNTSQVVALIRPQTHLAEIKDEEGSVTGYTPVVTMKIEKDGKPVELELTPAQAVEKMKEDESYFNLFKGKSIGGLSSGNNGSGSGDAKPGSMSMKDYKKHAKQRDAGN